MRKTGVLFLVGILLCFSAPARLAAQTGALDGKTFSGELIKKGKSKGDKDEYVFRDGKFRSTACDQWGFSEAPYTATVTGETTTFDATTESAKWGTMTWHGSVIGDRLEGTVVWSKKGKVKGEYVLRGTPKK